LAVIRYPQGNSVFSIGKEGYINRFFRDKNSATSWSYEKLGFKAECFCSYEDELEQDHIYAVTRISSSEYRIGEILIKDGKYILESMALGGTHFLSAVKDGMEMIFGSKDSTYDSVLISRKGDRTFIGLLEEGARKDFIHTTKTLFLPSSDTQGVWPKIAFAS